MDRWKKLAAASLALGALGAASTTDANPPGPRLVVLYATCTLNKDFLSPYNPVVRFTPNVEAFAKEATVFARHITEAGQSGIAYASLFSGVHANVHGAYRHPFQLGDELYQISEAYRDAGYETFFWSGHAMGSHALQYGQGVDERNAYAEAVSTPQRDGFLDPENLERLTATNHRFATILKRLKEDPEYKAFVQINFTMTHSAYHRNTTEKTRQEFLAAFPDQRPQVGDEQFARLLTLHDRHNWQLRRNFPGAVRQLGLSDDDVRDLALVLEFFYKASVFQLDQYFGRFLDSIRDAGLYDQSVIAFTADHGEILYRENALYKWCHGLQLVPEVLNVPLILHAPRGLNASRYESVTRSIDVYPTMAALSGVSLPGGAPIEGVDLSPALRGATPAPDLIALSHTSTLGGGVLKLYRRKRLTLALRHIPRDDVNLVWVAARRGDVTYKRIFDGRKWNDQVFDLSVDPGEATNRFDPEDAAQHEMFEILDTYKRLLVAGPLPKEQLSAEDLEKLRSLGYVGDVDPPRDPR